MRTIVIILSLVLAANQAQAEEDVVWRLDGFALPESVAADPASGMLFVSNMGSDFMSKNGDGRIARITANGTLEEFDWATGLNAPKGMDALGQKLYVADIDELVELDMAAGQVTNRYKAEGAQFLNDVAAAPDGRVFVSDSFGAAIYVLDEGELSLFFQDAELLQGANGLLIMEDALLVANLGDVSGGFENIKLGNVVRVDLTTMAMTPFGANGPVGVLDGIEPDGAGGVLLTDNSSGKLLGLKPGGTATEVATVGPGAADLEVMLEQGLAIIPITTSNEVVAVKLK